MINALKLWFFRDLSDEQRLKLFALFGLPVDEIGKGHGRQEIALRDITRKLVEMVRDETAAPATVPHVVLTEDHVAAVLNVIETRLCIIWPRIGAREEFANLLRVMEPVSDDEGDEDACVVCGEHLEDGDDVYWSSNNDGHMHAECATAYVDDDGNETEEPPKPFAFRSSRNATAEGSSND